MGTPLSPGEADPLSRQVAYLNFSAPQAETEAFVARNTRTLFLRSCTVSVFQQSRSHSQAPWETSWESPEAFADLALPVAYIERNILAPFTTTRAANEAGQTTLTFTGSRLALTDNPIGDLAPQEPGFAILRKFLGSLIVFAPDKQVVPASTDLSLTLVTGSDNPPYYQGKMQVAVSKH